MQQTRWTLILLALGLALAFSTSAVQAAPKEKETQCTDTVDNDGDGKIDCDDRDCKKDLACGGDDGGGGGGDKYAAMAVFADPNCSSDRFCSGDGNPYVDSVDVAVTGDKFRFQIVLRTGTARRFFLDLRGVCTPGPGSAMLPLR